LSDDVGAVDDVLRQVGELVHTEPSEGGRCDVSVGRLSWRPTSFQMYLFFGFGPASSSSFRPVLFRAGDLRDGHCVIANVRKHANKSVRAILAGGSEGAGALRGVNSRLDAEVVQSPTGLMELVADAPSANSNQPVE
jgi:hypothetical protein